MAGCKAAAGPEDEAERVLSQIQLSVQPGRVSTSGPGSEEDWTVYLLMRVPRAATLAMETMNGPLGLYDVDGKVTAKTHNGPIHLRNFSGEAEITAVNGPISLEGGKGSVKIHTENGPISVELEGSAWTGEGLTADAHNGPVTLSVPSGFQSSFVVESTNHSPMSCKASVCDYARKTWDDEHRRIEYGNGPATIHLSTVNGPVSVKDSRGDL